MAKYIVANMRVIFPTGKVAEKNPDRFATIYGEFSDENGNVLSIPSKEITHDMAKNSETVIDMDHGILILPSGQRGRPVSASVSQEDILAQLNRIRKGDSAN